MSPSDGPGSSEDLANRIKRLISCASDFFAKQWDPEFSSHRNFREDVSHVDCIRRDYDVYGDEVEIFWEDSEESEPSCKVEEVKEYCKGVCLDDFFTRSIDAGRRAAWLDDRSFADIKRSGGVRQYKPLTPTGLYRFLKVPRFGNGDLADADRRLIYIANLDPSYILALTETASFHQVPALRDAIWKHLAFQTSIRIKIPPRGFPVFQLEFHLPYFALRSSTKPKNHPQKSVNSNPTRQWTDLSFLNVKSPKSQEQGKYGIHEAQISVVICGSDHWRWVAYAFADTAFEADGSGDEEFSYGGVQEDPIASGGGVDANLPIWDPREYFLMVFETRMVQVQREWENLVRTVERSIKKYKNSYSSNLSGQSGNIDRAEDIKKTFDWTQRAIELLSQLLDVLSETNNAWERFSASNGDIGYFSDIDSSDNSQRRTHLSLRAIKEIFEVLKGLQQKLLLLEKSCHNSAQALQLRLTVEGNETVHHTGVTTELTFWVLSPFALATTYFSMPPSVIPFRMDTKSFIISIFVIMAVVKLLSIVIWSFPRWLWWWNNITAFRKTLRLEEPPQSPETSETSSRFTLRRVPRSPDRTVDGSV